MQAIRIPSHARSVIDDDGAVVLDLRGGKYYSLNEVAAEIWRMLESGASLEDVAERLPQLYDAPEETVREDIRAFVAAMQQRQLLDVGDG